MSEPVSAERLEEIRKRAELATPGPWSVNGHTHGADGCLCLSCDDPTQLWYVENSATEWCDDNIAKRAAAGEMNEFRRPLASCDEGPFLTYADADLAAHAPTDVAELLAEVDRLRAERDSFARMHMDAVVAVSDAIDAIEPDADVEGTVPSIWWLRHKVEQLQGQITGEAQR